MPAEPSVSLPPLSQQFSGPYLHYKGTRYTVIGVGRHTETLEEMVFYHQDDTGLLWVRPLKMFMEEIVVNGVRMPRFRKMES